LRFFHGEGPYQQKAGRFDVPGKPEIDLVGVAGLAARFLHSETRQSARTQRTSPPSAAELGGRGR